MTNTLLSRSGLRSLAIVFITFCGLSLSAQCPPSTVAGVHVVQQDETLFSISQQYKVSVDELTLWNSITAKELLKPCREMVVSKALVNPPAMGVKGASVLSTKQTGNYHTVRFGETAESIAGLYGYSEWKLREFNDLEAWRVLKPGAVVKSSECSCAQTSGESLTPTPTMASTTVAAPISFSGDNPRSYMTYEESAMLDEINLMRANPKGYVPYVRAFVKEENAKTWRLNKISAKVVNNLISQLQGTPALSQLKAQRCLYDLTKTQGEYLKRTGRFSHADANGVLPWSRTLNGCPEVGLGTTKDVKGNLVGNENLVAGFDEPRRAIIYLLIDEGTYPHGHRNTLLAPEWNYVAAYDFGKVNGIDHHWIQMFGR